MTTAPVPLPRGAGALLCPFVPQSNSLQKAATAMPRRAQITTRSHPPRYIIDRAADGDRHNLTSEGHPMDSARLLLVVKPDGMTAWDVPALLALSHDRD